MKSDIQTKLDENIPRDAVSTRDGGGKKLSYLETWYVIDRLNQVLGQGNWATSIGNLTRVFEGEIEQYSGKAFTTSYVATVTLTAKIGEQTTSFTEVGYGDGADKKSPGKAHELATKEAVSDALKRAAKNLGRSMGLALYDKTQEFVGETAPTITSPTPGTQTPIPSTTTPVKTDSKPVVPSNNLPKERPIKELVTATFAALQAQGKITGEEFKTKYQGGVGISKLSQAKLTEIYAQVQKDFGI